MMSKKQTRCRKPLFSLNGKVIRCGKSWEHLLYKTGHEFKFKSTRHHKNPKYKAPKVFCNSCSNIHNMLNSVMLPKGTQLR